ncbi:MAG TPA: tryptophan synthase subunit alpha [Candidatus Polarisedimenticolia bacterium]|nr:tryptophan synthase subunit alpha [Candidatus Polarisedimenticolia bacterium]
MSRIGAAFAAARVRRAPAFIPFVVAGDPCLEALPLFCRSLAAAGADIIEIGVPFSDPLADGPVIQRAMQRGLAAGAGLAGVIEAAGEARRAAAAALVLFTYYNPILRMGEEAFAERAARAGVDGVLVTDLPPEEGALLHGSLESRGIDPILMTSPTSGEDRIRAAGRRARGFLYHVSRTGVTGVRDALPDGLAASVAEVKGLSTLPVAVGFGISTPRQVRAAGALADGVVVGSALVAAMERAQQRSLPALAALLGGEAERLTGKEAADGRA